MQNAQDIKILTVRYMSYTGYKDKNFKFKSPKHRYNIVKLIDRIRFKPKVFSATGHTLNGTFI